MSPTDLFLLKWDHHTSTFKDALTHLSKTHEYSDATVGCSLALYPVHKMVLGACSQYFSEIFERTSGKHPIIILQNIASDVFEVLLSFMYSGQVEVKQEMLPDIFSAAKCLQIKGLAVTDSNLGSDIEDDATGCIRSYHTRNKPITRKLYPKEKSGACANVLGVCKRSRRAQASPTNIDRLEGQSSRVNGRAEDCFLSKAPVNASEQTTQWLAGPVHSNIQSDHSEDTDPYNDDPPLPCSNSKTKTTDFCNSSTDQKLLSAAILQPAEAGEELRTIALDRSFKDSSSTDIFEEVSIEDVKAEIPDASQVSLAFANDLPVSQQPVQSQHHQECLPTDPSSSFIGAPQWTTPIDTHCAGDSSGINTSADWDADSSWDTDTPVTSQDTAVSNVPEAEGHSESTHDDTGDELYIKQEANDLQNEDALRDQARIAAPLVQFPSDCGGLFLPSHAIFQSLHPNCNTSTNSTSMVSTSSLPHRTSTITVTRNFHKTLPSSHYTRSLGAGSSSSSSWSRKCCSWAPKKSLSSAVISKLPEFSLGLQPFLQGLVLGERERQFLERQFREEVVLFLDSEKLNVTHHAGGNSRWWYHAFGRKLYERYPNIQWTQCPNGNSSAPETRKRPLAPWTSAMKKVSTIRKSRRFLLKKKLEAIKQFSSPVAFAGSI